jgi:hypothetical protein
MEHIGFSTKQFAVARERPGDRLTLLCSYTTLGCMVDYLEKIN